MLRRGDVRVCVLVWRDNSVVRFDVTLCGAIFATSVLSRDKNDFRYSSRLLEKTVAKFGNQWATGDWGFGMGKKYSGGDEDMVGW